MAKMLILSGIPASGKTTWAREFIQDKSDWIIVNRDSIRNMFGIYWLPDREQLVTDSEFAMIDLGFRHGFNVIVDDTNKNPNTIVELQKIASNNNAEIEYREFVIDLDEAIRRDSERENPGGESVIRRFYKQYYENV